MATQSLVKSTVREPSEGDAGLVSLITSAKRRLRPNDVNVSLSVEQSGGLDMVSDAPII
jgi:hypothetical protein